MKPISMNKYLLLFVIAAASCQSNAKKEVIKLKDSLANAEHKIQEMDTIIRNREMALSEFIRVFNEIQENLNQVKEKQMIITQTNSDVELMKTSGDQIIEDIQFISDRMEKNEKKMAEISDRLKRSNIREQELEKAMTYLYEYISSRNKEIMQLRENVEKHQEQIKQMQKRRGPAAKI